MKGESRPFDENASGYVRSEAISVIFLQKRHVAKRIYAEVIHTKTNNDGYKEGGAVLPSSKMQQKLMEEFYDDIKFDKNQISYVEAHATGTMAGDLQEITAIDEVFTKNIKREKPLLIGSLKSNMGHAEAAAGIASIAKILISFENKKIPPNINLTNIRTDIEGFREKRIEVVTEAEELESECVAINCFGLGGEIKMFDKFYILKKKKLCFRCQCASFA
jgi:fatty acid synthase, animal type